MSGGASPMQTTQIDAIFHKPLIRLNLRANFKAFRPQGKLGLGTFQYTKTWP